MFTYSIEQWILFFYIYCFLGWCFESAYVSLRQKRFVNRGFLRLPMLPIYGSGALAILVVTIPVQDNLVLVYIFGMISATLLEFVTGVAMEAIFKVRYWDYSDQKFNFMGHICLSSSIAWGFLSILVTKVIHKPIEQMVLNMNVIIQWTILSIVSVLFVTDVIVSVKAAWDLRVLLEKLEQLKAKAEILEAQINDALEEQKERIVENLEEQKERFEEKKERIAENLEGHKERIAENLEEHKERIAENLEEHKERIAESLGAHKERFEESKEQLEKIWEERRKYMEKTNIFTKSLLRGNPSASSKRFGNALAELKEKVRRRKNEA